MFPIGKNQCFQRWKWNPLSLNFDIIFMLFFTISENASKSKFRLEMLNILSALKFTGSHFAFYEWKVSFSLISVRIFSTRVSITWTEFIDMLPIWSHACFSRSPAFACCVSCNKMIVLSISKYDNFLFFCHYQVHPTLNCRNTCHRHTPHGQVLSKVYHQNGHKRSCHIRSSHHAQPGKARFESFRNGQQFRFLIYKNEAD